jgi:hypothetical protein
LGALKRTVSTKILLGALARHISHIGMIAHGGKNLRP